MLIVIDFSALYTLSPINGDITYINIINVNIIRGMEESIIYIHVHQ